jgi:hypothetical protein
MTEPASRPSCLYAVATFSRLPPSLVAWITIESTDAVFDQATGRCRFSSRLSGRGDAAPPARRTQHRSGLTCRIPVGCDHSLASVIRCLCLITMLYSQGLADAVVHCSVVGPEEFG